MAVLPRPESAWKTLKNPLFGLGILSFGTFGGKLRHFFSVRDPPTKVVGPINPLLSVQLSVGAFITNAPMNPKIEF